MGTGIQTLIDVLVISLDDATERRQSATRQLGALGIPFRFFDAVRGDSAFEQGLLEDCDRRRWLLNCGRQPTPGEFGCYASHRQLWKFCADHGRPVLVMEDDFKLLDEFTDAIEQAEKHISDYGFLRLQTETRARSTHVASAGTFDVLRYTYAPHSLMCYAITPEVARRWYALTANASAPIDVFVKKFWEHGQPLYGLRPYTVTESALSIATSIRGRDRPKKTIEISIRRFLNKVGWHFRRLAFNFSHR